MYNGQKFPEESAHSLSLLYKINPCLTEYSQALFHPFIQHAQHHLLLIFRAFQCPILTGFVSADNHI